MVDDNRLFNAGFILIEVPLEIHTNIIKCGRINIRVDGSGTVDGPDTELLSNVIPPLPLPGSTSSRLLNAGIPPEVPLNVSVQLMLVSCLRNI